MSNITIPLAEYLALMRLLGYCEGATKGQTSMGPTALDELKRLSSEAAREVDWPNRANQPIEICSRNLCAGSRVGAAR